MRQMTVPTSRPPQRSTKQESEICRMPEMGKYPENSQSRGIEKLKRENGYVPKEGPVGSKRSTGQRYSAMLCKAEGASVVGRSSGGSSGGGSGGDKKLSDGGGSSGGRAERVLQFGEEEVVDGWPKWLINNVPKEVLACLVPKSADNYEKLDKVGQGTYSNVYKARDRETGKIVALKKVRFDTSEPDSIKFMAREIIMLQKLDHPNVVKLEGIATSRLQYSLYLVFDFMQSDLATIVLRGEKRLTEPQVKCYMHQLLSGLQHCHERGILHRDLKGSNLLIDKNGMLKIADFGLANFYYPKNKRPLTSRVVTLWYRAPELLLGSTDYGVGIDLWSAGCILAEMFLGMPIMPGRTEVEQLHRIFKLCGTPSEDYWKRLRLSTTFQPPKSYKPSLFEAFGSFPESSLGLLTILLALDPAQRGTASSALQNEFFYTSPLACDLSGLPVIRQHDDDSTQTNEKRRHRTSRMKQRSRKHRERRKKDLEKEKPNEDSANSREEQDQKTFELSNRRLEPGSSIGSSSSATKLSSQDETPTLLFSPITSKKKVSPRTQGYANGDKKIKKLPPLPSSKTGSSNYINNENMYRLNQVQRSASTREFRKVNQRKHLEMYAVDD